MPRERSLGLGAYSSPGIALACVCERLTQSPIRLAVQVDERVRNGANSEWEHCDLWVKQAEQAAAAASKLLVNEPKVSGGQPYRYRYRLAREGLGQANRGKHRENLCPHKSAPHHARGMCIACYQRWIKQQQTVTRDSQDELDRPSKQRRVATGSEMDSIACTACRRRDGEDSMVLCDGCDDAWHIYCMLPKRHEVPPPQHSDLTC